METLANSTQFTDEGLSFVATPEGVSGAHVLHTVP
jgi:hypothetical protein